jgi:ribosomal protein L30E
MSLTPDQVAITFFSQMREWELSSAQLNKVPPQTEEELEQRTQLVVKNLEVIFNNFLSLKALSRGQSRCVLASYSMPPEYAIEITKTEKVSDKKHFIYAKGSGWMPEERYTLVKETESWRIEYREYLDHAGKWVKEREL